MAELNNKKIVKLHKKESNNEFYYMLCIFDKDAIFPIMKEFDLNLKLNIYQEGLDFEYKIKNIFKIISKLIKVT